MKQKYEELEMDSVMFWSVLRTATAVVARGSSGPLWQEFPKCSSERVP